jgi:hypothetical protein
MFLEMSLSFSALGSSRNAGIACQKIIAAIKGIEYEVTKDNVMSLSKGKTKVTDIGPATVKKMMEFFETGKMVKLEEKRAASSKV